jgi:hypothetical protein
MAIDALYRTIRRDARQLARRESLAVIWAYSQFLQVNDFQMPEDGEVAQQFRDARPRQGVLAEWTLEHLAREVIRYADEEARDGRSLKRWDTLAHLANTLRDLEGEIYRDLVGGPNIQLELMRIMHRQFVWQQQHFNWTWIIRYYKLFNTPALTAHAEQATGLSIDQIFLIGMCYLGHFFQQPRWVRRVQVEIPWLNGEHLTRLRLRPTRCMSWRGWCKWTPVEPAGTCPGYKSSKLDGSEDPWTTGARDEHTAIGGGNLA